MKGIKEKRRKAIEEFEHMTEMAELRALSKVSLERPLTTKEYERYMFLGEKQGIINRLRKNQFSKIL